MTTPVIYDISIGKHKPHSGTQTSCPFCHRETLTDILDEKGDIIWLVGEEADIERVRQQVPVRAMLSASSDSSVNQLTKQ